MNIHTYNVKLWRLWKLNLNLNFLALIVPEIPAFIRTDLRTDMASDGLECDPDQEYFIFY